MRVFPASKKHGDVRQISVMHRGKTHNFKASASTTGVVAVPDGVTTLEIDWRIGGRSLLVIALFASGHVSFLPLTASATAFLKCPAFALFIASLLALCSSR